MASSLARAASSALKARLSETLGPFRALSSSAGSGDGGSGWDKAANVATTLLDGKVFEATVAHPRAYPNAKLAGTDQFGNKYFEITEGVQYGRHRFVVYANIHNYSPLSVPPEWHGWLHDINNANPTKVKMLEPSYKVSRTARRNPRRMPHAQPEADQRSIHSALSLKLKWLPLDRRAGRGNDVHAIRVPTQGILPQGAQAQLEEIRGVDAERVTWHGRTKRNPQTRVCAAIEFSCNSNSRDARFFCPPEAPCEHALPHRSKRPLPSPKAHRFRRIGRLVRAQLRHPLLHVLELLECHRL